MPPKSQPISAVIGTFVAHKVPACYTIGRTPQGIKKSGCQIPRFQRISTLHDTESRFLVPWGVSCLCAKVALALLQMLRFEPHLGVLAQPNISRSSSTLFSFSACCSSVNSGCTCSKTGGAAANDTSCSSSRMTSFLFYGQQKAAECNLDGSMTAFCILNEGTG